jgi:hypothetical protein
LVIIVLVSAGVFAFFSIEKVNDAGKIWFTLQFTDRSDIRIVTEIF